MRFINTFVKLCCLAVAVASVEERNYATSNNNCQIRDNPSVGYGTVCRQEGTVRNPAKISTSKASTQTVCRDSCYQNSNCKSFSYKASTKDCTLAKKSVNAQNLQRSKCGVFWYDRGCYEKYCPPTCYNGKKLCSGQCKDTSSDNHNCGSCGTKCNTNAGAYCKNGVCKNPPSCSYGEKLCSGKCKDTSTDNNNCGTCGNKCDTSTGASCKNGVCKAPTCPNGKKLCSGLCKDTSNDPKNCGDCGKACGTNQLCQGGHCKCPLPSVGGIRVKTAGTTTLPDPCSDGSCPDLRSDKNNCGRCGNKCPGTSTCQSGSCKCPAVVVKLPDRTSRIKKRESSQSPCTDGSCPDLTSDKNNCGTCGNKCKGDTVCSNSQCICPSRRIIIQALTKRLTSTQEPCTDGSCPDLDSDNNNCGTCGNTCKGVSTCQSGQCLCPAIRVVKEKIIAARLDSSPQVPCTDGSCPNLDSDKDNCGTCGNKCEGDTQCISGSCKCPAISLDRLVKKNLQPTDPCDGGACPDLQTDKDNCGTCGNKCTGDSTCISGACKCPAISIDIRKRNLEPTDPCTDGSCPDLQTDKNNCGTCGNQCKGTSECISGACKCPAISIDINKRNLEPTDPCTDGSCPDFQTDKNNCGSCGTVCEGQSECISGQCKCPVVDIAIRSLTTTPCDGGACPDFQTDNDNCGSCGMACEGQSQCISGECKCPAVEFGKRSLTPTTPCDGGACPDLQTDKDNCGSCGAACGGDTVCSSGQCQCPSSITNSVRHGVRSLRTRVITQQPCDDSTCPDLMNDDNNCGSCGNVCMDNSHCKSGVCKCSDGTLPIDLDGNDGNCGICDNGCGFLEFCSDSSCHFGFGDRM